MRLERLWAATRRIPLSNSCIRCTCRRATGRSTRGGIPRIASKFPKHSQEHFVRTKCHGCSKRWLWEMPHIGTFFPCQLLTGARRDEARLLKWAHLDLDRALWHKPTTKTGVPQTCPCRPNLSVGFGNCPASRNGFFPPAGTQGTGCKRGMVGPGRGVLLAAHPKASGCKRRADS